MMSDSLRGFLRASAWILIIVGVLIAVVRALGMLGLISPQTIMVNQNAVSQGLAVAGAIAGSIVQGGLLLALTSIDERLQNRSA